MKRARLLLVVSAAALAGTVAGCGGSDSGPKPVPADAIAIVGDEPVTRASYEAMLAATRTAYRAQGRQFPRAGTAEYRNLRARIVDDFVQQAEFEQRAKSDPGVEITDEEVDRQIAAYKKQTYGGSEAQYLAGIKELGLTDLQVRTRLKAGALADAVYAKVSEKAAVSDDDIEAYYKAHRVGYSKPATREARQISVKTKALADKLEKQLKGGADFAKLAEQYSTDRASSAQGGRIQTGLTHGEVLPALERAGFALKTREISEPVHTQFGWHIIQALSDLEPAKTTPLDEVRTSIEQLLLQQKKSAVMKAWVKDTRAEYVSKIAYASGFEPPAGTAGPTGSGGR